MLIILQGGIAQRSADAMQTFIALMAITLLKIRIQSTIHMLTMK
jgi:hypothetical protein